MVVVVNYREDEGMRDREPGSVKLHATKHLGKFGQEQVSVLRDDGRGDHPCCLTA